MKHIIVLFFILIINLSASAQNIINSDTTINQVKVEKYDYLPLTKSPTGAALRSLAFPGWGQVYVEKYWKVPIFTGGAGFLWYRIIDKHIEYKDYKKQLDKIADKSSFEYRILDGQMVSALDNRDLSGLYLIGVYILSIVDAYAGAHLFDFNISSNLSYSISPSIDFIGSPYIKMGFVYSFNK